MINSWLRRLRDERGGVHVTYALLFPVLLFGFIGLAYDGGRAVNTRATGDDAAQSAGRAAISAVVLTNGGAELDAGLAASYGQAILAQFDDVSGSVTVTGPGEVTVVTTSTYSPAIFSLGGPWTFTSTYVVEAQTGVSDDGDVGGI